jgi:DNA-binding response OmpR family regulator
VPLAEYDAAIQSLLRRVTWERGIIEKGDLRLCGSELQICRNGKPAAQLSHEQFRFFAMLVDKSPEFVPEADITRYVFGKDEALVGRGALDLLVHRLRGKLGLQLARRVKNKKRKGWIYVQPVSRHIAPAVEKCRAD